MAQKKSQLTRESTDLEKLMDLVENVLPGYCRNFFYAAHKLGNKTKLEYAKDLKTFFIFLSQRNPLCKGLEIKGISIEILDQLDSTDIDEYLNWLTSYETKSGEFHNNNATKARKLASLKSFYKYMVRKNYLSNNVAGIVERPDVTEEKDIIVFSQDEKVRLLDYIDYGNENLKGRAKALREKSKYRDLAIFTTLFGTGLRISELTGIDLEDLDLDEHTLFVHRKGNSNEIIYFGDEVENALTDYLDFGRNNFKPTEEEKALFISNRGTRINDRTIEIMLNNYCSELFGEGHRFTPHKCRATFGTQLYEETGDIYLTADVLGHKDVNTTRKHYAKMDKERRRIATQMVIRKD